jgi:hypothetical protein
MIMIRHFVENADAESAKFYYEQLMEQCKFLARRFRKRNEFLKNVRDNSANIGIDSVAKPSQMAVITTE